MKNEKQKTKNKKLEAIPKIHRRLFKLWSEAIRIRSGLKCEYCGIKNKAANINGVSTKLDSHHFVSRKVKDMPLKFDINNGICACPICHKWGMPSFHRDPITTITWLMNNIPERYHYVLENSHIRVDLDNRAILLEIEKRLLAKEPLDLEKLKQIEKDFPREIKVKKTTTTTTTEPDLMSIFSETTLSPKKLTP